MKNKLLNRRLLYLTLLSTTPTCSKSNPSSKGRPEKEPKLLMTYDNLSSHFRKEVKITKYGSSGESEGGTERIKKWHYFVTELYPPSSCLHRRFYGERICAFWNKVGAISKSISQLTIFLLSVRHSVNFSLLSINVFHKLLLQFWRYQPEILCVDCYWPKEGFKLQGGDTKFLLSQMFVNWVNMGK